MSPAWKVDKEMGQIKNMLKHVMEKALERREEASFKVESRRADKKFPLNSMELNRQMGGFLLRQFPQLKVDVHNPDIMLQLEIREFAYAYYENVPGVGGMPVGTSGKATLLLSGGIDSPVAGWMIAKRGVQAIGSSFSQLPIY